MTRLLLQTKRHFLRMSSELTHNYATLPQVFHRVKEVLHTKSVPALQKCPRFLKKDRVGCH